MHTNQSHHRSLERKTPKEASIGKKPTVDHLRIFGFPDYIHIPKDKRRKLDPSGIRGTLFGYSNSSKAYRIFIKEGH